MAKTYEALLKYNEKSGKSNLPAAQVLEGPSPDLSSDKQMVDLNYMIDMKAKQDNLKIINFLFKILPLSKEALLFFCYSRYNFKSIIFY